MAEVSYQIPQGLPDASLMAQAAQRVASLPDPIVREEALLTLFKLLHGVLENPEDFRKRRVKKGNEKFHMKVGRHADAVDFLRGCGFEDGDDEDLPGEAGKGTILIMPVAYFSRLTDAHHTLAQACSEAGVAAPSLPGGTFNPYKSNSQKTDTTRSAKAPEAWKNEAGRIHEEIKKRTQDMKDKVENAPAIDLRPSAFWQASGRRLEEVVRETAEAPEADPSTDNALLQAQVAGAQSSMKSQTFSSAEKRRLVQLSRTKVYEFCIIRVICPDKSVLQVHFRAGDRGEHVLAQIKPLLAQAVQNAGWYIYQSPPLKRLAPKETLAAAGLTPGANMYLGFEGQKPEPPFLAEGLASQLGPPPEGPRGVNAPEGPTFSGEAMGWGQGRRLGGKES